MGGGARRSLSRGDARRSRAPCGGRRSPAHESCRQADISLYGPFTTEVKSDHGSKRKALMSRTD